MKAKYFLFGFLILTLGAFCSTTNTRAADYELGISENDELILEIKIFDEEGIEDLFQPVDPEDGGKSWRDNLEFTRMLTNLGENEDEVGAKMKLKIDWINESDDYVITDKEEDPDEKVEVDYWTLFVDYWGWIDPDNDFNPEPDSEESAEPHGLFMDPDDLNTYTYVDNSPYNGLEVEENGAEINDIGGHGGGGYIEAYLCPTPVSDYLDDVDWQDEDFGPATYPWGAPWFSGDPVLDDIDYNYDSDGNKVIFEGSIIYDDDPPNNDYDHDEFIEEWTFDESTGWLSLYQLMNDDDEVLYEIAAVSAIPGYELPILLGVTAALTIGLIYIIRKRV